MGAESSNRVGAQTAAVFLSYASQDVEAARRICDALRAAGIEVWLDQSELRGGDAWDRKIRDQIRHCALFIPVISAHSQARLEGYFRREWKFAVERKRDIADELAFLLPVVIDDTPERGASVPEGFHEVQWTRLPLGAASQEFIEHVSRLLTGHHDSPKQGMQASQPSPAPAPHPPISRSKSDSHSRMRLLFAAAAIVGIVGYIGVDRYVLHRGTPPSVAHSARAQADKSIAGAAPAATFAPPPHSLAVLPFVNMSGDKDQDYFSDGLTEEILNSLARINELQVSARTSSFSFKGKDVKIGTIARELNVGAILEGSVRRSGRTIRVTAQLNNTVTGFHLWSETYDRDLKDVLKLQTDVANAVANALKVTLLGDVAAKIEMGGTQNPAAFDAYVRAAKSYRGYESAKDLEAAIAGYTEAIRLDPDYAIAYADRALARADFATNFAKSNVRDYLDKAQADGRRAVAIANNLGKGHLALAYVAVQTLDFTTASQEYRSALAGAPGDARVLSSYGAFAVFMGETEAGLAALHRSVVLDPLSESYYNALGQSLLAARRYNDAISTFASAKALDPDGMFNSQWLGLAYYSSGDFQSARTQCESRGDEFLRPYCLALVYNKLGRQADAKSMLATLQATWGETAITNTYYAMIYAQWGDITQALDWLETAMRNRDPYLAEVKMSPWLDPLRKEPRFQAIERELRFPSN